MLAWIDFEVHSLAFPLTSCPITIKQDDAFALMSQEVATLHPGIYALLAWWSHNTLMCFRVHRVHDIHTLLTITLALFPHTILVPIQMIHHLPSQSFFFRPFYHLTGLNECFCASDHCCWLIKCGRTFINLIIDRNDMVSIGNIQISQYWIW